MIKATPSASPHRQEGGVLRLRRLGSLPLNREVQVGNRAAYQAFRNAADMHTYADNRTPWAELTRIKGLPDPLLERCRERPN